MKMHEKYALVGPVACALDLTALHLRCDHHNDPNAVLPHHLPEGSHSRGERPVVSAPQETHPCVA
jgi:hypothetical protein